MIDKLIHQLARLKPNKDWLPIVGIVAFSGCSVHALGYLLFAAAEHDTPWFWTAAVLVEICTAWLVWSVVETMRRVTKSNISKQDRRFYTIILVVFLVLSIPSLSVSVVANVLEFGGNILLGLLFPTLSVACAIGAGLPETVKKYERQREMEIAERKAKREQEQLKRAALKAESQPADIEPKERRERVFEYVREHDPRQKGLERNVILDAVNFYKRNPKTGRWSSTGYDDIKTLIEEDRLEPKNSRRVTWKDTQKEE